MLYELNTRYTLIAPKGTISQSGISAISIFINEQRLDKEEWKKENPESLRSLLPSLPVDWVYEWLVTGKGDFVGTFPKRVAKYYFKQNGIRCPNGFLEKLGNIAKTHSETAIGYTFEIVNQFDWQGGDFGDGGSCFFGGSRDRAREILAEHGAFAIRFYNDEGNGFARAWLVAIEDTLHVLFNGYGLASVDIARVFCQWQGLSYKKIRLSNNGTDSGVIYVNSGNGYLIGNQADIERIESHDFQWHVAEYNCYNCDCELDEDETYSSPDGDSYCQDCYYDIYTSCERCGDSVHRDDSYYADGSEYCESCLNRLFEWCENCDEYRERGTLDESGHCAECAENNEDAQED